ncbi:M16 family metallopeptidase [Streptomyces sp. NPDC001401]|uniref:M16 family metallopeptidase n=1 Tax=Streptomyces sp. NPDC001401 TaxID=3364570 RepID=UPI003673C816
MQPSMRNLVLENGVRVVTQKTKGPPTVAVSVQYGIGFRNEPRHRSGFAHLFEHMMFQGSKNVPGQGHFSLVQACGGVANGNTYQDHTEYHQVVPSTTLDRVLFAEADRMRALDITEENLGTQIDVVKEEIRSNVLNKPYGGFPWTILPQALFTKWENTHNGYGDLEDISRATLDDCTDFFESYYSPSNAVISLCGNIDHAEAETLVREYFDDVPPRAVPAPADLHEPWPMKQNVLRHKDPMAPKPATALGYRMPGPADSLDDYAAHLVLSALLTGGHHGLAKQVTGDISSGCGLFGPLKCAAPETFLIVATHDEGQHGPVAERIGRVVHRVASGGVDEAEVAAAVRSALASLYRRQDSLLSRAGLAGTGQILFGNPHIAADLVTCVERVGKASVAEAAASLCGQYPAVVHLVRS